MANCTKCGAELSGEEKFCTQCGTVIEESAEQPEITSDIAAEQPVEEAAPEEAAEQVAEQTAPDPVQAPPVKEKQSKLPLIRLLCFVGALMIAALVAAVTFVTRLTGLLSNADAEASMPEDASMQTIEVTPEETAENAPQTLLEIMERSTIHSDFVSPTKKLTDEMDLYGVMHLSSIVDDGLAQQGVMTADVWGYISHDEEGKVFLELFDTPEYSETDPLLSYYVELHDDHLTALIGQEDAWLNDIYLWPEDAESFSPVLENGRLYMSFPYDNGQDSYLIEFYLRQTDMPWDELCDPCFPTRVMRQMQALEQGDGLTSAEKILEVCNWLFSEQHNDPTYEVLVSMLGVEGGDGGTDEEGRALRYWQAETGELIYVSFAQEDDGRLIAETIESFNFDLEDEE